MRLRSIQISFSVLQIKYSKGELVMKKICCLCLALFLSLGVLGCGKPKFDPESTLKPLSSDEVVAVTRNEEDKSQWIIDGEIIGKMSPNVLVLELRTRYDVEEWGEIVYVITDDIEKWCEKDMITVYMERAERPIDTSEYPRIYAEKIHTTAFMAKPIIYLYPEEPTECSLKLTLVGGELTCTYPEYNDGWKGFVAHPDGTLVFPDGKEYYALYWEGTQIESWDFSSGFSVKGEDTAEFLEWALAAQGLTAREANEFIVYWLPLMENNEYNVISFQTSAYTDTTHLEITPAPDTLLRVFMAYYPSDTDVDIEPQAFDAVSRDGFTVVEWGGSKVSK